VSRRTQPAAAKAKEGADKRGRIPDDDLRSKAPRPEPEAKPKDSDDDDIPFVIAVDEPPQTGVCTDLPAAPPAHPPPPATAARREPYAAGGGSSGQSGVACPSCRRPVSAEAALRPWCPHCGEDLQLGSGAKAPTQPDKPAEREASPQQSPARRESERDPLGYGQPPSFDARLDKTFRIYVLKDELLFLDAPASEDRSGGENVARNLGMLGGGLIGGMIGGAIAEGMAGPRKAEARRRRDFLNSCTTEELQEMADQERTSFRAEAAGFRDASIVALTWWERLFAENTQARLHFQHRDRGRMSLALPTHSDVRTAIEQLSAVLGDALTVNAVWDYGSNRYVRKT
jgi:hypothetical protein